MLAALDDSGTAVAVSALLLGPCCLMFVITPALLATTIACALPVQAARLPTIAAAADAVTAWELSAAAAAARSAANRAPATMFRAPSLPRSSSQQLQVRVTSLHCRMYAKAVVCPPLQRTQSFHGSSCMQCTVPQGHPNGNCRQLQHGRLPCVSPA